MSGIPEKVVAIACAVRDAVVAPCWSGVCVPTCCWVLIRKLDVEVYAVEPASLRTLLDEFGPVNVVR